MIAAQRHIGRRKRIGGEAIEHAACVGPAVDVIAERDRQRIAAMRFNVARDGRDGPIEQIEPPVNVANRINPGAFARNSLASKGEIGACR
jgi:hypothetical protein